MRPTAGGAPTLVGDSVRLRAWREADIERLAAILGEPSVAQWWTPGDALQSGRAWLEDDGSDTVTWVIELDGQVIGSVQVSEESDPDYRSAGIDIFLGNAHQGQGLGPDALRTLARWLFEARGHHRLTIDPAAANERAIRAYRKVGFQPIGIAREYERGADGTWHDGLLMDMLRGELR